MNGDLFTYLAGWIPLGLYLIPLVGGFFTAVWMTVWFGTKFWDKRQFWKIFIRGWVVILSLYFIAWFASPPPPIPIRLILSSSYLDADSTQAWQIKCLTELINDRLLSSRKAFVVMTDDYCPVLDIKEADNDALQDAAVRTRASWIVEFKPDKGGVLVTILKRSGRVFKVVNDFSTEGLPFRNAVRDIVEFTGKELGDKRGKGDSFVPDILQTDSVLAEFFSALVMRDSGRLETTNAILFRMNQDNPSWVLLRRELARTQLKYHPSLYKDQILNALLDLSKQTPQDVEVYRLLGEAYLEDRNWEKAESALKLASNLNPDDPRNYFYLSRLSEDRLENLHWKSKRRLLDRALQLAPAYEAASISLAKFYVDILERRLALETLEKAQQVNPASVPILLNRSAALVELRRNQEAIDLCEHILTLEPGHPGALYNMGIALVWMEKFDEGIAILDSSYRNGGTVDNLYYMGVAYQRKGDWEQAEKYFEKRFALPTAREDRVAVSARERVKILRRWIAQRDSLGAVDSTSQQQ